MAQQGGYSYEYSIPQIPTTSIQFEQHFQQQQHYNIPQSHPQPQPPPLQPPLHHHHNHHLPPLPHQHHISQYPYSHQFSVAHHYSQPISPYPLPDYAVAPPHYATSDHHHPPPPRPHHHHHRRNSSKRPREPPLDAAAEAAPSTKRQAIGNDILFRVVVPSGQIGKVIGKGGHRVQKVRDDTKANVKIADAIARFEERVIIISSKEKNDGGMSDAEKALLQIAALILADDGSNAQTPSVSAAAAAAADPYGAAAAAISAGHSSPNSVRLLIAGSQAGGLIGVSGQNIEKLRTSSGAAIAVLAPNQLPLCAFAHESDRLVQISGEVPSVLKAIEEIGVELRANPPKQVISISPTYNLSIARAAPQYMDPNAVSAEYVTLDMVISETMVGGLIGRAGSNIAKIRTETGAMIKVFGAKGEQKHRQIQLIGAASQVGLAKQRVDEYIYTQLTQQSDVE